MGLRKQAAVFLIWLVLTIPLNVSIAFGSLGEPVYDEVITKGGSFQVAVPVEGNISVTENNLRFVSGTVDDGFTSCGTNATNASDTLCHYDSGSREWPAAKNDFEVKLYNDYFVLLDKKAGSFYVDDTKPSIKKFEHPAGLQQTFGILYSVQDSACSSCGAVCIGLGAVEFTLNGTPAGAAENVTGCSASGEINLTHSFTEGESKLCIVARDAGGLEESRCDKVFFDSIPPMIGEVQIIDSSGTAVTHYGKKSFTATVRVNVTDAESGVQSVVANLTGLNKNAANIEGDCTESGGIYLCTWQVSVTGGDGSVAIVAADNAGNTATATGGGGLTLDETGPVVTSIDSGYGNGSTKYLREVNNVTMAITEAESGMDQKNAYLNVLGAGVRATGCTDGWVCTWKNLRVSTASGTRVPLTVSKLTDDVGNSYGAGSVASQVFYYDSVAPKVESINITPIGTGLDILIDGDVVSVIAMVREEHSGLSSALADFGDFFSGENYSAGSCIETEPGLYECAWEYSGSLKHGDVRLNIVVYDNAGNRADSADHGMYGKIFSAGITERAVNYWEEEADVYDVDKLNRNFLWMSSSGTIARAGIALVGGGSYVHAFTITGCKGTLVLQNGTSANSTGGQDYPIRDQFYYPDRAKSDKYILINIPQQAKGAVGNASTVRIVCEGYVIQAGYARGRVFKPDETVNATIEVKLTDKLFSTPDTTAIDKINHKKNAHKQLSNLIDGIEWWTKWMTPICSLMQLIKQILSGVCQLVNFVYMFYQQHAGPSECFSKFKLLDKLWYGPGEYKGDVYQAEGALPGSSKSLVSVGFWCDWVLCEECSRLWDSNIPLNKYADKVIWDRLKMPENGYQTSFPGQTPQQAAEKSASYVPTVSFSPFNQLFVAIVCMPPCLTGILAKLKAYRAVIETYNICMNVAATRGTDVSECDHYYSSQVCIHVLGEFWYLVDSFLKQYLVKLATYVIEQKVFRLGECNQATDAAKASQNVCMLARLYRTIGWFLLLAQTIDNLEKIYKDYIVSNPFKTEDKDG